MQTLSIDQLVGQKVGRYRIERLLGRGYLNAVYLAQHPAHNKMVALTLFIIHEQFSSEARHRFLECFTNEATTLTALHDPHLLPVYEYGEQCGYPYLVMPYMMNGSLADILKQRGRCTPEYTQAVIEQIATGLEHMHSKGVIHGMLKPSNILLSSEGTLLMAGFGLMQILQMRGIEHDSKSYAHLLSITDPFLGAVEYMAPEIVQGQPISIRSDIYALGIMLFELLSGTRPFTGTTPLNIALQHVQRSLPSLCALCPDIPVALELIVNQATERNPARRFQRASELAAAVAEVCSNAINSTQRSNRSKVSYVSDNVATFHPMHTSAGQETPEEGIPSGVWQLTPPIISSKLPAVHVSSNNTTPEISRISQESIPLVKLPLPTPTPMPAVKGNPVDRTTTSKRRSLIAPWAKRRRAPMKRSHRISRRQAMAMLATGGIVAAGTVLALNTNLGHLLNTIRGGNTRMLPSFPRAASTGQVREYTFEAAPVEIELGRQRVPTWAYNGVLPGPEIRLTEGDTLRVTVKNRLPQGTTIHWHGVPLVNNMDGVPDVTQKPIMPGQDFVYNFIAPAAGTYLYHSHAGLQLDRGLYGPLIIESKKEAMNYDHDFVLVLDDWLDGMPGTPEDVMKRLIMGGDKMGNMGNMGNMGGMAPMQMPPDIVYPLYLINGRPSNHPWELEISQGQKARLRLINASASTIYRIALQGHRMTVTHTDGQPVEPVEVDAIRIGMGERYDILVTGTNHGVWQLAAQVEGTKNMVRAIFRYKGNLAPLPPATYQPPELMRQLLLYSMLKAAPGVVVPPASGDPDRVIPIKLSGGMGQYVWKINDQVFEKADQIQIEHHRFIRFQFANTSMMPHPMHLHGHFFQLDNGTGRGPLKDTVLVDPMQQLTIDWISDNPGAWAFHCHNRYHEDTGMMRIVKVG